jgi:hypothetical protein
MRYYDAIGGASLLNGRPKANLVISSEEIESVLAFLNLSPV